jgi:predicted MPP superfamily phosphohydrolase
MYPHFASFVTVLIFIAFIFALFYITIRKKLLKKRYFYIVYWATPLFFTVGFLFFKYGANYFFGAGIQKVIVGFMWFFVLTVVPFLVWVIFYWLDLLFKFIFKKTFQIRYYVSLPIILIFLAAYFQGTFNCNNLEIRQLEIEMQNLPPEFDGTKIAVMGDTHLGNFVKYRKYFNKIGHAINSRNVDLLLFTGDLVNTMPKEGVEFINYFNNLQAKYGKYAVMGNHDFCKYFDWSSESVRESMVYKTKALYRAMGFSLLENDYVLLEKDTLNSICIVGADETGGLQNTLKNCPQGIFKILLLHNPTEWETQIIGNQDVALTLAGHTHALQCAYEFCGKKFSPSQWLFKQWDGLYSIANQHLFITRGVGYVGLPVRMGLKPDIAILTLKAK